MPISIKRLLRASNAILSLRHYFKCGSILSDLPEFDTAYAQECFTELESLIDDLVEDQDQLIINYESSEKFDAICEASPMFKAAMSGARGCKDAD